MNTKQLIIGGVIAYAAYYLWKQSQAVNAAALATANQAALNPANRMTPTESAQSAASTLSAQMASMFPG